MPGTPGANDNTSGVAATLALARRFAHRKTDRTLRFVAFTNEESPYAHTEAMGSRDYSRRCRERGENVVAMMSLETIGYYDDRPGSQKYPPPIGALYPSEGNFIGFIGNLASGELVRQVVKVFRERRAVSMRRGRIARGDIQSLAVVPDQAFDAIFSSRMLVKALQYLFCLSFSLSLLPYCGSFLIAGTIPLFIKLPFKQEKLCSSDGVVGGRPAGLVPGWEFLHMPTH